MTVENAIPQMKDPTFQEILANFQNGEWDLGFQKLDAFIDENPSLPELKEFRQEMGLRARIDQYEDAENKAETLKKVGLWSAVGLFVLAIISAFFWGVNSYSNRVQAQIGDVRQNIVDEVAAIELNVKFADAQNYLSAGRPEEALQLLESIAEENSNFPGLEQLKTDIQTTIELENSYQSAVLLVDDGDFSGALVVFQEIQETKPGYKDVGLQIQELESKLIIQDLFQLGEDEFAASNWENAILTFENLRSIAPRYQVDLVFFTKVRI